MRGDDQGGGHRVPILRAGVHRIWTDNTVGVTPRGRVKSMVFARAPLSVAFDSIIVAGDICARQATTPTRHHLPGSASGAPLSSEDGTRTGRPGAATLNCVDDRKARAASADQKRLARLNERLRHAFIDGAEMDSVKSQLVV